MPTKLKRISICLTPEVDNALNDMREAVGISPASFIAQIVNDALPIIQAMTQAANSAKRHQAEAFEIMSDVLTQTLHAGSEAQLELLEVKRKLRKSAGVVGKRRKRTE